MYKLTPRILVWTSAVAVSVAVGAIAWNSRLIAVAATSDPFVCTIANVASYQGFQMTDAPITLARTTNDKMDSDLAARAPGASVAEQMVATVRSDRVEMLDGRQVVIRRVDGMPDGIIFGPNLSEQGPARVSCAVAVYDASDGAFLIDFEKLEAK